MSDSDRDLTDEYVLPNVDNPLTVFTYLDSAARCLNHASKLATEGGLQGVVALLIGGLSQSVESLAALVLPDAAAFQAEATAAHSEEHRGR